MCVTMSQRVQLQLKKSKSTRIQLQYKKATLKYLRQYLKGRLALDQTRTQICLCKCFHKSNMKGNHTKYIKGALAARALTQTEILNSYEFI
jgi:hypothetical protein